MVCSSEKMDVLKPTTNQFRKEDKNRNYFDKIIKGLFVLKMIIYNQKNKLCLQHNIVSETTTETLIYEFVTLKLDLNNSQECKCMLVACV